MMDLSRPPDLGGREVRWIDLHHEGDGSELDSPAIIRHGAMSRTDQHFGDIPYHIVIWRPVVKADDQPAPLPGNPWAIDAGRPLSDWPASVKPEQAPNHNPHAIAIVVAGRWDREPLPTEARDRLVEVLVWLVRHLGLPVEAIQGHREVCRDPHYTVCPGYDPGEIRALVRAAVGGP